MSQIKIEIISFLQSFVSAFFTTLAISITALPMSVLLDPHTYTVAFLGGFIFSVGRTALKFAWQQIMPVSFGGVK